MKRTGFVVTGNDERVCVFLAGWLERNLPHPPTALTLNVRVGPVPPAPESVPIFEQPATLYFRGPADELRITWEGSLGSAVLTRGRSAELVISEKAAGRIEIAAPTFVLAVATMLYRRVGWHHVHAASLVDPHGRGWLFAGNSGSGKSTTAAFLSRKGWRLGGDDGVFLEKLEADVVAHPVRKDLALRKASLELLGSDGGTFNPARDKSEFEITGDHVKPIKPDCIAFTSVAAGEKSSLERVNGARVLSQLVSWSAWVALEPDYADEHLQLLADLGAQADCYTLTLAEDFFDNPHLLSHLP